MVTADPHPTVPPPPADRTERVPCPLDPSHAVPFYRLQHHVKVCPKVVREAAAARLPYHVPGVNKGDASVPSLAAPDAAGRRAAAAALSQEEWRSFTQRMLAAADALAPLPADAPPIGDRTPAAAVVKDLSAYTGRAPPPSCAKHDAQNEAIVAAATAAGAFGAARDGADLLICEAGAGRGYLAAAAAAHYPAACLAMIDCAPGRKRADRHLRHRRLCRVNGDLADVDIGAIEIGWPDTSPTPPSTPPPHPRRVTILGKHLCGQATDFTLRAALRVVALAGQPTPAGAPRPALAGVAVAPCCHHRLVWDHYVGQDQFLAAGFTRPEFELVAFATTWLANAHGARPPTAVVNATDDAAAAEWRRQRAERAARGAAAKRLLDGCRAAAVQAAGLVASLAPYVGSGVSPENRLLVVVPAGNGE